MNTESANMYGLLKAAAGADGPIPGPPGAPAAPATFHEHPAYPRKISGRGLGGVVGPLIDGFGKLMK